MISKSIHFVIDYGLMPAINVVAFPMVAMIALMDTHSNKRKFWDNVRDIYGFTDND